MIAKSRSLSFEKVVAFIKAKILRRKSTLSHKTIWPVAASATERGPMQRQSDHTRIQKDQKDLCFACNKSGNFANRCWFHNSRPRGRGHDSQRRRRIGGGKGGRGLYYQIKFWNRSYLNFSLQKSAPSWGIGQRQDNPPSQTAFGQQTENLSAKLQSYGQHNNHGSDNTPFQGGSMAKTKFRTTIATSKDMVAFHCLIDSGAAHQFSGSRKVFLSYKKRP